MRKHRARRRTNLGEVTKRDFIAIAEILCAERASTAISSRLASYFKSQNPRFDAGRFVKATQSCRR